MHKSTVFSTFKEKLHNKYRNSKLHQITERISSGFDWVRSSVSNPTDTQSPVYPNRPIRPLPKQRIRSRLSLEAADSITFPPVQASSSPLFGSPNDHSERSFNNNHYAGNGDILHDEHELDHVCDCGGRHSGADSDEDDEVRDRSAHRNSWPGRMMRYPREYMSSAPARSKPPPAHSSTSSADGYESFENTNNKKKRKIPISGASGTGLGSDGMGVPAQSVDVSVSYGGHISNHHHHSSSSGSGVGISGAGRGRNSKAINRPLSERRPLVPSSNGSNSLPKGSSPNQQGIISAAMANAESSKSPSSVGQENVSLLQRQQHGSSVPKDFTFEWPSDSGNKMSLSSRGPITPPIQSSTRLNANRGMAVQGTQTSPNGLRQNTSQPLSPVAGASYGQSQQPMPPPKARRRRRDSLREAAQQRKARQAYENSINPPNPEDRYVCEFCEYEAIFGHPPSALIRQYEIRDRQMRKRAEAQRRNLEKVKAKGRKNRKGAKSSAKNNIAGGADLLPPQNQPYDPRYDNGAGDLDSQGDEYFDDGYEDPAPLSSQRQHSEVSGNLGQAHVPPPPPPPPEEDELGRQRPVRGENGPTRAASA